MDHVNMKLIKQAGSGSLDVFVFVMVLKKKTLWNWCRWSSTCGSLKETSGKKELRKSCAVNFADEQAQTP